MTKETNVCVLCWNEIKGKVFTDSEGNTFCSKICKDVYSIKQKEELREIFEDD